MCFPWASTRGKIMDVIVRKDMRQEEELRKEILEKVGQLYRFRKDDSVFEPGNSRVHYAGRVYDEQEIMAAVESVMDFWLTLGKKDREFIEAFTSLLGVRHGLVVNSGSSANLIAVSALCSPNISDGLREGDEVITTALTFPTTLNPILQNRLVPVFLDVEPDTYNIDAYRIEAALSSKTKAIMIAHTLGNPVQMDVVIDIARSYGLYVVEDTCDALGSAYCGKMCGSFGDIATFSFYAAHHITMGEGGAAATRNTELWREMQSFRDWGRACFCSPGEEKPDGACGHRFSGRYGELPEGYDHKYVYSNIGYNLKPLDIQCAIGVEQLKKLPGFTSKRKYNFSKLQAAFAAYEKYFVLPRALPGSNPSWFAFPVTVRENAGFSRKDLIQWFETRNIETRMLFTGDIRKHPAYKNMQYRLAGTLENTRRILENAFFIGVYPGITEEMLQYVTDSLDAFMNQVTA